MSKQLSKSDLLSQKTHRLLELTIRLMRSMSRLLESVSKSDPAAEERMHAPATKSASAGTSKAGNNGA